MESHVSKKKVAAWALWDWGTSSFSVIVTTFVFAVYITSDSFGENASSRLGITLAIAGVLIALLAPVFGQLADKLHKPTLFLTINTILFTLITCSLFFVTPSESNLNLGLFLLALGTIFFELAQVNYNTLLTRVSHSDNAGKISGLGWGLGYIGGILVLLIAYFGFIAPEVGLFGVTDENGLNVRTSMLIVAIWIWLFATPVLVVLKDPKNVKRETSLNLLGAYKDLYVSVKNLWKNHRKLAYFMLSAALYRDGLAAVFTFGAVIAARVFGFSDGNVIIFGIVANLVSGVATLISGVLDDKFGPLAVIKTSLVGMLIAGIGVFVFASHGPIVFWILGLILVIFVGPAQNSSRTYLIRSTPPGKEGEIFGLYATTGRALSFIAPALYSLFIIMGAAMTGSKENQVQQWGIIGILIVLASGLGSLMLLVKKDSDNI